jgi:hypothetical protein
MNPSEADQQAPRRAQYAPPRIEEELEFETTALASCGKADVGTTTCDPDKKGTLNS